MTLFIIYKADKKWGTIGSGRAISKVIRKDKEGYLVETPWGKDYIKINKVLKEYEEELSK